MDPSPGDDEAPRDPGVLKIHQPGYTDEDYEGKCLFRIYYQIEINARDLGC